MTFDLSKPIDTKSAQTRFKTLLDAGKVIVLKERRKPRTGRQNRYMHVLFALFGIEFGYSLDESKTLIKRECDFMRYEKNGQTFLRRTRDMDSVELTKFIEWFRNYSASNGLYLLSSDEYWENNFSIDREIESNKVYL